MPEATNGSQDKGPSATDSGAERVRLDGKSRICLTNQTIAGILSPMLDSRVRRLQNAYPAIFLACHQRHVREDGGGKTITERQASVLDHLDAQRPVTLSKLAGHMGVGRSTMSITVSRLVRGGYVASRKSKLDSRLVELTLTAAGARVRDENALLNPELVRAILRKMKPEEAETALQGIECLARYAHMVLRQRKRENGK
jgi:MarR family transcriptional regulator, organic hydroperoxide resistance regulator